jgi:hypothetical protein
MKIKSLSLAVSIALALLSVAATIWFLSDQSTLASPAQDGAITGGGRSR